MLSLESAKELITLGRRAIADALEGGDIQPEPLLKGKYGARRGVFTTLLTHPEEGLRGCVGFPLPHLPLWEAVVRSAVSAAFRDPRFPPLKAEELGRVVMELSVLSEPEELREDPLPSIRVGVHGILLEIGDRKSLLLPQVATRYGWDAGEFLDQLCLKAGLCRGSWREKDVKIYRFRAEVFKEVEPWGEVEKVELPG